MGRKKKNHKQSTVGFGLLGPEKIRMEQFCVMNQEALKRAGINPTPGHFARASARWFMDHVKQLSRLNGYGGIERKEK